MPLQKRKKKSDNVFGEITFRLIPYWPLFVLLLIFSLAGAWLYLRYATPMYEATAVLLVKDERKGADDSRTLDHLNIYHTSKIVENEIEVLRSRSLMQKVVKQLALYAPVYERGKVKPSLAYVTSPIAVQAKDPDAIVEGDVTFSFVNNQVKIDNTLYPLNQWVKTPYGILQFTKNPKQKRSIPNPLFISLANYKTVADNFSNKISVDPANKLSTIVELRLKDEDPVRATDILHQFLKTYSDDVLNDKNALTTNTLSFIDERLNSVASDLNSIEKRIQSFKAKKGAIDLSEQGRLFLKNVSDNDSKATSINMQLSVIDQVEKYVLSKDNKDGIVPSTLGMTDQVLSTLVQKLYESQLEYERLKRTTAENNPVLVSLSNEMAKIRPSILDYIRSNRANLIASQRDITTNTNAYTGMLRGIPEKERELVEISREQAIKNDVYSFLLQRREETALSQAATIADSRIVDDADASPKPVSPKKIIVFPVAVLLAFVLCYSFILSKELLSNKVIFRSEIEELTSIPIIAEISKSKGKSPLVVNNPKRLFIAEQFRQLRAAIGVYGSKAAKKKILVTSTISGEGKSFVSTNLALSLANSGKKVLLVDLDLRNPKVSATMGVGKELGVSEYLSGKVGEYEIIRSTEQENLYVIGAGSPLDNPTELLMNGKITDLFKAITASFDFVVADSAPVDAVTDSYIFSELCDTTLFVIRHGKTPKKMVELLDENQKVKVLKNISIVFNGVKSRGFGKQMYGYGYGYGYEYVYKNRYSVPKKEQAG